MEDTYPNEIEKEMLDYYNALLDTETTFDAFYKTRERYPTLKKINGYLVLEVLC